MRCLILFIFFTFCTVGKAQTFEKEERIIRYLDHNQFRQLKKQFSHELKNNLPIRKMEIIWKGLEKQFGAYKSHEQSRSISISEGEKSKTLLYFEKGSLDLETVFDSKGLLAGIFLRPKSYNLPTYGQNLVYNKENIYINSGIFQLPGEILYPLNLTKKVPLVIFVHGSGANDRYESIGPVMVFKDLALGLLNKGIASMVYDKRTKIYKNFYDTAQFTIWDETVEDAINAFKLAKTKKDIDTNQIYIIGHSQGGYALPLILKNCQGVKGGISMAGCSRPLDQVLQDQYHYLINLDGKVSLQERLYLNREMKKIKLVRSDKIHTTAPKVKVLAYWPTSFWSDIQNYNPVEELKKLDVPVLFLQGERDYQVTDKDFSLWKSAYLEKYHWSFISYTKLNHLFIEGEGKPNPAEYWKGGNLPSYLINDIDVWIKKSSKMDSQD
jgi:fermentation-respiration switch protein FrsA (DUF1100 family)